MKLKVLYAAIAAGGLALPAYAQHQQHQSGTSSDAAPRSSQSYPTGSTATPSGHSPGQGAGQSGSATADMHRGAVPGGGHGASAGASGANFSQFDANGDGMISRAEWDGAQRGGSAGGASSGGTASSGSGRGAPEPSSHAPSR